MASNPVFGMGVGMDALTRLSSLKFTNMDRNSDGTIDHKEWKDNVIGTRGLSNSQGEKLFKQLDTDKSGTIDAAERATALAQSQKRLDLLAQATKFQAENALSLLGGDTQNPDAQAATNLLGQNVQQAAQDVFAKIDQNADGKIDKKEFLASVKLFSAKVRDHATEFFDQLDKDKNGTIDRTEAGYKDVAGATSATTAAKTPADLATIRKQFLARLSQLGSNYASSFLGTDASGYSSDGNVSGSANGMNPQMFSLLSDN